MTAQNILIVDDDAGDRKLLRRHLGKLYPDARLYEAENGRQALGFTDTDVDVAFVDYLLPGSTGLELIAHLKAAWPRLVLFVITGQGDEEVAKSAILRGADDYIPKSAITARALERMVKNALQVADMRWRIEEHRNELQLFSDVLVHDLRAPVRALQFLSSQIQEDYTAGEMKDVARGFELIKKSVARMSDLIERLACHINPHSEGAAEVVTVDSLVESLRVTMVQDIAESGARIECRSNGLSVRCFPPEITQLLQNLVGNSIKYSGGRTPRIQISAVPEKGGVRITVADNGIGVPVEYRQRIFEPFTRLQRTSGLPGTGLGLATCAKIAKRHNGSIWCDPQPGEGTAIHFTLHLKEEETETA
ncbi:sensor histidine kinase [Cribrihabitans neustonicus]|uniref:sensor histidine kinase n=1 Tax=Cribrihabitans neustonicus TaxID=1429085 RepID=UPI003B5CD01F